MAANDPLFRLRIPASFKDELADIARANNRSLNAEILNRLERSRELERGLEGIPDLGDEISVGVDQKQADRVSEPRTQKKEKEDLLTAVKRLDPDTQAALLQLLKKLT